LQSTQPKIRKIENLHIAELLHNLAVCSWIIANSVWMTGEFYAEDSYRPYATVFFGIGLLLMAYYYFIAQYKKTQD
jgi:hypothetical protein